MKRAEQAEMVRLREAVDAYQKRDAENALMYIQLRDQLAQEKAVNAVLTDIIKEAIYKKEAKG